MGNADNGKALRFSSLLLALPYYGWHWLACMDWFRMEWDIC
jgi:hypothetical protein